MYAIIETGGNKQYRVKPGDELDLELLGAEGEVKFDKVLLVHDGSTAKIGQPYVEQHTVHADVIGEIKGPKVIAYKYKRGNYRRTVGHRQRYTRVKITKIA